METNERPEVVAAPGASYQFCADVGFGGLAAWERRNALVAPQPGLLSLWTQDEGSSDDRRSPCQKCRVKRLK